jgi:hypothetical protein
LKSGDATQEDYLRHTSEDGAQLPQFEAVEGPLFGQAGLAAKMLSPGVLGEGIFKAADR